MASLRLQPVATSTTAPGTATGHLAVAATAGITRHAILNISHANGGWVVEVVRVIDGTKLLARMAGFVANSPSTPGVFNRNDLSAVPNGATVSMPEQWVADLYSDDAPDTLSIPTK